MSSCDKAERKARVSSCKQKRADQWRQDRNARGRRPGVAQRLAIDFTGRDWLAEDIDHRLNADGSRFVLLMAEPSFGKSAFVAQPAADHANGSSSGMRVDQLSGLFSHSGALGFP